MIKNPLVFCLALLAMILAIVGAVTRQSAPPAAAPAPVTEQPAVVAKPVSAITLPPGYVCTPSADGKTTVCVIPEKKK